MLVFAGASLASDTQLTETGSAGLLVFLAIEFIRFRSEIRLSIRNFDDRLARLERGRYD